jgi:hypothetical protein
MHINAQTRHSLLQTLYAAREARPGDGWATEHQLKDAHGEIAFALSVLVETGQVKQNGYRYRITGAGVIACEATEP